MDHDTLFQGIVTLVGLGGLLVIGSLCSLFDRPELRVVQHTCPDCGGVTDEPVRCRTCDGEIGAGD